MEPENVQIEEKKGRTYVQWMVAFAANTTLLTNGMLGGWVAPMMKTLQSPESPAGQPLTDREISLVASFISIAACLGVPMFAYLVDIIGRKKSILIIAILQALCWIINIYSSTTTSLLVGRFFAGLSAGGCYNVIPTYVREISQDNIRGILGSLLVLMQNMGYLIMFALGFYLNYYVVLWISVWIPIITTVTMLFAPEAPAFLVKKGLTDQAASTLSNLRGIDIKDKIIQKEIDFMKNEETVYKSIPKITYLNIWQNKAWRRGCFLNIALMTTRTLSGTFALLTFTPAILAASGITVNPEAQSLSIPAVTILASFVSMSCVEKFGRKPILLSTFIIATLSLSTLATTMLLQTYGKSSPVWIPVVAIIMYQCAYAGGISPMPYIIMAEMFNFQIRAKVMGIFSTYAYFLTFLHLLAFTYIVNVLGAHNVFYCFAGINILGVCVSAFFLRETKGKTVDEIEKDVIGRKE
ncbi:unnamed protein product [Arctia plantaginis]|uniref:Major facilitator superfamily (MFS) profile domain-containing protein n=1 Tax=Arctia plantaginis TaxID=874455 RepID=A0A8S0Z0C9_ARCPL|nr:unnamed protein product [Arctia plantaginis]CAB3247489.1 unnamed protein product [Arctia plantaginis]